MAIRRGIAELLEAIPERIEVSGAAPTWEVTGGSFDSVVSYADAAFEEPVVIDRRDRNRWWPRVTLTVTTDPELAATAPPLESLRDPQPDDAQPDDPQPDYPELDTLEADMDPDPAAEPGPEDPDEHRVEDAVFADEEHFESFLEEIFARQERLREQRGRIPEQRRRRA
jgi:hypothetical protein